MFMMLVISSVCELVKFDRAQSRTFSEVCANDKYFENSIFEFENHSYVPDDSDDGYNISGILLEEKYRMQCNYNVYVSQALKDRTLAFFNRVRWLTGYERNLTWDYSKDEETCHCSYARWLTRDINYNIQCLRQAPKWTKGCVNSNSVQYMHRKISSGVLLFYDNDLVDFNNRKLMLSPNLTKTSMCTVSSGKQVSDNSPYDYFTMNFQYNASLEEELPFIASPPPGFLPYYMMPSVVSLLAKDVKDPVDNEFKIYYNGNLIRNNIVPIRSSNDNYNGYAFNLSSLIKRNYSHLFHKIVNDSNNLFFPPGTVFGFEATNNGKTYAWNTTLVDCTKDASKYPDPTMTPESSNPMPKPTPNVVITTTTPTADTTKSTNNNDDSSSRKSGLSHNQKIGIGIAVTVGVAAVVGAVVGGLFLAGVIGGGSAEASELTA